MSYVTELQRQMRRSKIVYFFNDPPLLIRSWCVFLSIESRSPSFCTILYGTHTFVDSDDILIWNRGSKLRISLAASHHACSSILGSEHVAIGGTSKSGETGILQALVLVRSPILFPFQCHSVAGFRHVRASNSSLYVLHILQQLCGSLLNELAHTLTVEDANVIISKGHLEIGLNQSIRLVVDINRMHFLCMCAGSITLASTMCPYTGRKT